MTQPTELGTLLSAAERATFHGAPVAALAPLAEAIATARAQGRTAEAMAAAWLLGTTQSALGRYAEALAVLEPLTAGSAAGGSGERLFAALAGSALAGVQRDLGRVDAARAADLTALALTDGTGVAALDALLGLAADELADGRPEQAVGHLDRAARLLPDAPVASRAGGGWRQQVRLGCTQSEVALGVDRPAEAGRYAARAVALAEQARAPTLLAAALLRLGRAEAPGSAPRAVAALRRAANLAAAAGALPLVWPANSALAVLLATVDPSESRRCQEAAQATVATIAEGLPAPVREPWLRHTRMVMGR